MASKKRYKIKFIHRDLDLWWKLRKKLKEDNVSEDLCLTRRNLLVVTITPEYKDELWKEFNSCVNITEDRQYDHDMKKERVPELLREIGDHTEILSYSIEHTHIDKIKSLGVYGIPTLINYLKKSNLKEDTYPEGIWYAVDILLELIDLKIEENERGNLPLLIQALFDWYEGKR